LYLKKYGLALLLFVTEIDWGWRRGLHDTAVYIVLWVVLRPLLIYILIIPVSLLAVPKSSPDTGAFHSATARRAERTEPVRVVIIIRMRRYAVDESSRLSINHRTSAQSGGVPHVPNKGHYGIVSNSRSWLSVSANDATCPNVDALM
jgi:hypothetical protein